MRRPLALILVSLLGGFLLGRWSLREPPASVLQVGSPRPLPERPLGPPEAPRRVLAPEVRPGRPAPPPAPIPADFGAQLHTTATALPALPQGGDFHAATFARLDGDRLTLRTVEWLDTPTGPVELGPARTTEAPLSLRLPPAPDSARWSASLLLAAPREGRPVWGGMVQHSRGPLVLSLGAAGGNAFAGVGVRW